MLLPVKFQKTLAYKSSLMDFFLGPCSFVDLFLGRRGPSRHRRSRRTEQLCAEA